MTLTEDLLRQAAWESINNAISLHESACLLAQNSKAPTAAALAIVGLEEFAKAILFTIAAAAPDQRVILESRLGDLREHNVKHVLTGMVDGAQIENSEGWAVARGEGYPVSVGEALGDMLASLASAGIDTLMLPRKEARQYYEKIRKEISPFWREHLLPNDPSKLKEIALYVDIGPDGKLSTPGRIARDAEIYIRELEYFLGYFRSLPTVLEDDETWAELAARLRQSPLP